ncbi:MAG: branched-chain amino acid aminotransferase [Bacteroidetes bacterium]|nr:branched-chain amino acid aminotransferase [Bacteroidota bacterium]
MSIHITVEKTQASRIEQLDKNHLDFGRTFTDHMFQMHYAEGEWQQAKILPFGPIQITPALNVLHYGQAVFEGMKAFFVDDKTINIFRPDAHHARFNRSCRRMCIPETTYDVFIEALVNLIRLDSEWMPQKKGTALYIRPFIFANEDYLAARVSSTYAYYIIMSPVGAYYAEGFNPVSLTTSPEFVRAVPGGTGEAKTAGNYAASFLPAQQAQANGYTQVLWLDAREHSYIEEVGTMNIHFVINDTLITPSLSGSVLSGITRDSVLKLAEHWGLDVQERRIAIGEVMEAAQSGLLTEAFGSGTAAVISPVGTIAHEHEEVKIGNGAIGPLAKRFFDAITGIQYGELEDSFGWTHTVHL